VCKRVTMFGWNPNTANLGLGLWLEVRPHVKERTTTRLCVYVRERGVEIERERETRRRVIVLMKVYEDDEEERKKKKKKMKND